jgi:hypothetical protein
MMAPRTLIINARSSYPGPDMTRNGERRCRKALARRTNNEPFLMTRLYLRETEVGEEA